MNHISNLKYFAFILLLSSFVISCQTQERTPATSAAVRPASVINFNDDWEFVKDIDTTNAGLRLSDKSQDQTQWEQVTLPHTARIEPIEKTEQQWQGDAFYRKTFQVPASDKGRHIALKFEAAMQVADVYLNGERVFQHKGGYLPFYVDISNEVNYGEENTLLVKLNNEDNPVVPPGKPLEDLDFNYYSGLYRNVYLLNKDKLHISDPIAANRVAGGGVFLHYDTVSQDRAVLMVQTEVKNDHPEAKAARIRSVLRDKQGNVVAEQLSEPLTVEEGAFGTFKQRLNITNPNLWSPDSPYLYDLSVELVQDGQVLDQTDLRTGVRSFRFAADGFYLNGEKLFLRGTNRHQEYPYVGYALSDNARYRDAYKIKEAGFNFVRSSHYPQSPAFLDAADELGLLVMDAIPGWQFFGNEEFQERSLQDTREMVRRDRNHPSVVVWEASLNESGMTEEFMEAADRAVHEEYPFEDAYSSGWVDYAYDVFNPARQHAKAPDYWNKYDKDKPLFIAEYGDWEYYAQNAGFNQKQFEDLKEEERTSRQLRGFGQKRLLQQALNYQEAHNSNLQGPAVGDANWLMYDYKRGYAPDIESSGIMDIVRLPKFAYYFYQSQAGPELDEQEVFAKPMIFIANYWNDPTLKTVKVYSNVDEVELQLNGKTIARQKPDQDRYSTHLNHPPFTFEVPQFEPGTLKAIGYLDGKPIVETIRRTPGAPAKLGLRVDYSGKKVKPGTNDMVFVYADILDQQGTIAPEATNPVTFTVAGDAEIVGTNVVDAEAGIAAILLKAGKTPGPLKVTASAPGLQNATTTVEVKTEGR
ncbi:beta-galactosidase [Pontibacter ummariensis]|uniref:Beta-galactosidase n=1 Tax=Pontibacter ummariensis TaxID=1610492 RepID=A0A239I793_9BACT|nr:glycoside hydrolase family 2 TIM barrel-domain containing protein [Pontibacter ummariensis]PRY10006.1 beta-galactosidase [Pontibacter ummariensis]SNS89470.1 beta-galactosidase [Pontibacter ummariensis]